MIRGLGNLALAVLLALAGLAGYQLLRTGLAADVYRERLEQAVGDYEALRGQYNQAIRRTAVTDLIVKDGHLSVVVRDAGGTILGRKITELITVNGVRVAGPFFPAWPNDRPSARTRSLIASVPGAPKGKVTLRAMCPKGSSVSTGTGTISPSFAFSSVTPNSSSSC